MKSIDVTDYVDFENNDDECLPLTMCCCGKRFKAWDFIISIYPEDITSECPECGAKFYFKNAIRIYQIIDEDDEKDKQ